MFGSILIPWNLEIWYALYISRVGFCLVNHSQRVYCIMILHVCEIFGWTLIQFHWHYRLFSHSDKIIYCHCDSNHIHNKLVIGDVLPQFLLDLEHILGMTTSQNYYPTKSVNSTFTQNISSTQNGRSVDEGNYNLEQISKSAQKSIKSTIFASLNNFDLNLDCKWIIGGFLSIAPFIDRLVQMCSLSLKCHQFPLHLAKNSQFESFCRSCKENAWTSDFLFYWRNFSFQFFL